MVVDAFDSRTLLQRNSYPTGAAVFLLFGNRTHFHAAPLLSSRILIFLREKFIFFTDPHLSDVEGDELRECLHDIKYCYDKLQMNFLYVEEIG